MSAHQPQNNQGESLLQNLINDEKAWTTKVDEAKKRAAETVESAQREAERMLKDAHTQAADLRTTRKQDDETHAQSLRDSVLKQAQTSVKDIEAQAKRNQSAAVKMVVDKVLP